MKDNDDAEDIDDDIEPVPKIKRKKAVKKIIPIGRNGLKKKRVIKTVTTTDAKGYFGEKSYLLFCWLQTSTDSASYAVSEDFSEYESVSEEESEPEPPKTTKKKSGDKAGGMKKAATLKTEEDSVASKPAPKAKPKPKVSSSSAKASGNGQKGGISAFFGKPKAK